MSKQWFSLLLLLLWLLVRGISAADRGGSGVSMFGAGGGGDDPSRNWKAQPIHVGSLSTFSESDTEEELPKGVYAGPGIRLCKWGCGEMNYLRKRSCANPDCKYFYMASESTAWVHQRGRKERF